MIAGLLRLLKLPFDNFSDRIARRRPDGQSLLKRYEWGLFCVVLMVAALVRLPGMIDRPIWYDEAITLYKTTDHYPPRWPTSPTPVHQAIAPLEGTPMAHTMAYRTVNPYFRLLFVWRQAFGKSIATARAFSLVFSLGTIALLYLLLRAAAVPYPLIPTLVYALSTGAVDYGHEARAYALASFCITGSALCAYQVVQRSVTQSLRAAVYALGLIMGSLIALPTHYLTLFPLCAIWLWVLVYRWPAYRKKVVVVSLAMIGMALLGMYMMDFEIPVNFQGRVSVVKEIAALIKSNLGILWVPKFIPLYQKNLSGWLTGSLGIAYAGWTVLLGATLVQLRRQWTSTDRKFWLLIIGLVLAPTLGVLLVDSILDTALHRLRYVLFAGPALAVMVSYGLTRVMATTSRWGMAILACVLTLQLSGIYWGPGSRTNDHWARWAQDIYSSVSSSHVVAIVGHWPHQGALIYELNALSPDIQVVSVQDGDDPMSVYSWLEPYQDVWIAAYPINPASLGTAQRLKEQLLQSGQYTELSHSHETSHLRRTLSPSAFSVPSTMGPLDLS